MELVFIGLATVSIGLCVWQWLAGLRFPIRRTVQPFRTVPLSILKPLKGVDSQTEGCIRSWFDQDYPSDVELLFGVSDETDPACEVVRKLAPQFPNRPCKLVICDPILGANGKVSKLYYLAREARYEHIVISDADVEIGRGFLTQLTQPLLKNASLVNCFYILRPFNAAMALEAVAVNADFWTQVLQGTMLRKMDFALGAVMATTRTELRKIGGLEGLLNHLADDYQLGNRIARAGGKLEICCLPVTCWTDEQSWRAVWKHQLRWARTIRVCQPWPWFFSILANTTLWPVAAWLAFPTAKTAFIAPVGLLLRALTAKANYARLTGDNGWIAFGLAPLKDAVNAVIWALSFAGNTVVWRGTRFHVDRGGKLTPLA